MNTRVTLGASTLAISLLLSGCPTSVRVVVTNTTQSAIAIVHASGYESKIAPGATREEAYDSDCLRVRFDGQLYEFQPEQPPQRFYDRAGFNAFIYALFTPEKRFQIYHKGGNDADVFELKPGCHHRPPTGEYLRGAS